MKYLSKFLAQSKESSAVRHNCIIQSDYLKLFGFIFRLDATAFLDRGKFFNPENYFGVFEDQPYTFLLFLVL